MRNKILFSLAIIGMLAGLVSAYIYGVQTPPQSPAYIPASNPYKKGIYANGIIESYQASGSNINIYPEVPGTIKKIFVTEGAEVRQGTPLLLIEDSVQRATSEQQKAGAEAAQAQIELAKANLKSVQDQLSKQRRSYYLDPKSISKDALDNAENAVNVAKAGLDVAKKQYTALLKAYQAATTLLAKYTITAPVDGMVLSINAAVGGYISSQGTYGTYTGQYAPILVLGDSRDRIDVRCYIDEILIHRLPKAARMSAQMFIRGTNISLPLEFVRVQPYVSPKIQLSSQIAERVDVRVLPVIFRVKKPANIALYPGQLVDVYIGEK